MNCFFFLKGETSETVDCAIGGENLLERGAANPVSTHLAEEEFECFTSVLTAEIWLHGHCTKDDMHKRNQWMKFMCHVKPHEHSVHRISVDCVAGPSSKENVRVRAVSFSAHSNILARQRFILKNI